MRTLVPMLIALLFAGCNWSDLEAEFFAAAPGSKELSLVPPVDQQSQGLRADGLGTREDGLQRTEIYDNVVSTAHDVNGLVSALCAGIDAVRDSGIPASKREQDALTWGPFDDDQRPGLQAQVVMRREPDRYLYELQWGRKGEPDSFAKVIGGEFFGERAVHGHGNFVLDADQARAIGVADPQSPDDLQGISRVELAYDMSGGVSSASLRFVATGGDDARIDYQVEADGGGWMSYRWLADFVAGALGQRENLTIETRWLAGKAGYATATVKGGDLGGFEGKYAECWNEDLMQAFAERNWDCGLALTCGEGERESCVLPPP